VPSLSTLPNSLMLLTLVSRSARTARLCGLVGAAPPPVSPIGRPARRAPWARSPQTGPVSETEPASTRVETVLVVVLYVVPLTATVALLVLADLPGLALALLAVEACVASAVVVAKAPERGPRRVRPLVVGLLLLAVAAAAGAAVLLT